MPSFFVIYYRQIVVFDRGINEEIYRFHISISDACYDTAGDCKCFRHQE